jgi:predicted methyltransferase
MPDKTSYSSYTDEEKQRILEELHEKRRREQKAKEAIKAYLADKRIYLYKGKEYYKVKDYKQSFYVLCDTVKSLADTIREVELEKSGYTANRRQKGFIKWDMTRKSILISLSNVRVYYKPFEIEKA